MRRALVFFLAVVAVAAARPVVMFISASGDPTLVFHLPSTVDGDADDVIYDASLSGIHDAAIADDATEPTFDTDHHTYDGGDYGAIADHADLSFGDATDDSAFSGAGWVHMTDATKFPVIVKTTDDLATKAEYYFGFTGTDKLSIYLYDNQATANINTVANTASTSDEGGWLHVGFTYDGGGANSGLNLYTNGVLAASTDGSAGAYTAMHDLGDPVHIGVRWIDEGTLIAYATGKLDGLKLWSRELTAGQMAADAVQRNP